MQASGVAGTIAFDGHTVVIARKSIGLADETRSTSLASLTAIDYRPASFAQSGFVRIIANGTTPSIFTILDKNAVPFKLEEQEAFIEVYCSIYASIHGERPDETSLRHKTPIWVLVVALVFVSIFTFFWFKVILSV